jgi:small-conductance mechanosensitive channel
VNFAIDEFFRKHNIEIPFPQRDLRLRSASFKIERDELGITTLEEVSRDSE